MILSASWIGYISMPYQIMIFSSLRWPKFCNTRPLNPPNSRMQARRRQVALRSSNARLSHSSPSPVWSRIRKKRKRSALLMINWNRLLTLKVVIKRIAQSHHFRTRPRPRPEVTRQDWPCHWHPRLISSQRKLSRKITTTHKFNKQVLRPTSTRMLNF